MGCGNVLGYAGVMTAVVEALDELSKKYDGREALVRAGEDCCT